MFLRCGTRGFTLLEPSLPAVLLCLLPALRSLQTVPCWTQAQRADLVLNAPRSRTEDLCVCSSAELTSVSHHKNWARSPFAAGTGPEPLLTPARAGHGFAQPPPPGSGGAPPCDSPAILVWGLSCSGFIAGCGAESRERAEPCDKAAPGLGAAGWDGTGRGGRRAPVPAVLHGANGVPARGRGDCCAHPMAWCAPLGFGILRN